MCCSQRRTNSERQAVAQKRAGKQTHKLQRMGKIRITFGIVSALCETIPKSKRADARTDNRLEGAEERRTQHALSPSARTQVLLYMACFDFCSFFFLLFYSDAYSGCG